MILAASPFLLPIAGVTPFQQMVQYVRASDRRIAAESRDLLPDKGIHAARMSILPEIDGLAFDERKSEGELASLRVSGGAMAGMTPQ